MKLQGLLPPKLEIRELPTDYGLFEVVPLTPEFGAEVRGVDIADINADNVETLRRAWIDWKVLFWHDQDMSVDQHVAFGRLFGELEVHPFLQEPDHPEIVALDTGVPGPSKAAFWHTDVSFRECPPMGSILRGRVIPAVGGDTCWMDMERVWDGLDDVTRSRLEGRTATHTLRRTFGKAVTPEERDAALETYPDQHHPIVRTHPVSGRKCLYLNRPFVDCIDGLDREESDELLNEIWNSAQVYGKLEYQVRFRWRENSVAMWDNRCTQHYALYDYSSRRRVERVTLAGTRPV